MNGLTSEPKAVNGKEATNEKTAWSVPSISLPKGGGAIRGIGEKFAANPVTGTGSMTIPIPTSPGRSGFGPQLSLSYDSGAGNGPYGFGWNLSLPSITRKTDKGLPKYEDANESDVFILSGAEDLVPVYRQDPDGSWVATHLGYQRNTAGFWVRDQENRLVVHEDDWGGYRVRRYRPRVEGLFARIERWTKQNDGDVYWRSISKDNITTFYGKTKETRIVDPVDPARIFSWLICQSYDDKGNAIVYEYKPEDSQRIFEDQHGQFVALARERNRNDATRSANRYLKHIKYGNRKPNRDANTWQATDPAQLPDDTWMFEVVFDYGEGHYTEAAPDGEGRIFAEARLDPPDGSHWPVREDPFSIYRAGFEVRTYRLCRRALMFHHFPQELGIADCLVRSTEFSYAESPIGSFIISITQSGYVRQPSQSESNRYLKKSLPPLEFEYSRVPDANELAQQPIQEVDAQSLENLPVGLDGSSYQWMDLDGEGTSGILTEQADGWYYRRNISANNIVREDGRQHAVACFGPVELVASKPALGLAGGGQFLDLAGDGQVDLVAMEGSVRGFYERTEDATWEPFQPFLSSPQLNTREPNLKFVDLTGDGHADILITEGEVLSWYPSLAEEGFGPAIRVSLPGDEEKGPRLVFADGTQSIYQADLSGDGLSDLVRIRNGEVCYWPNLGYGLFGAKVTMDNSPWFDSPDQFDQRRMRLADTDGSGTTDILYVGRDCVQIYFNQSGNGWSKCVPLPQFPATDNISSVQVLDLLGNGTACLVWSSPLPVATRRPMRYLTLMEEKPHLLIKTINNLGAETIVSYAPSTKFYLQDKQDGKPCVTKLPFPVHVVERVEVLDRISRNRFVTRHAYHDGYFDGEEREFRGFGMVEQWDTEELASLKQGGTLPEPTNIDDSSYVPPSYTKTWFHTGIYVGRNHVSDFFAGLLNGQDEGEYFREPGLTDSQARQLLLDDAVLPHDLTADEEREACRTLKGAMLRQEVYALDGTEKEEIPYTIAEQNFTIECLQPREGNRYAVFFSHPREVISYHYERSFILDPTDAEPDPKKKRKLLDPRLTHALTLEVDKFGNVLKEASIGYGRRQPDTSLLPADQAKQTQTLITYTTNQLTNAIDAEDDYRTPIPAEAQTYELTGLTLLAGHDRFTLDEILTAGMGTVPLPYEAHIAPGLQQKRLIEHVRTLYRPDDLGSSNNDPLTLLPLATVERLALPGESCKLAFTPGLVTAIYDGRVTNAMLAIEGRYVHTEGDANWWIPSGQIFYSPSSADTSAQELAFARQHFFLPHRFRDPFHTNAVPTESFIAYDGHHLLMQETRDPLGNRVTVGERNPAGSLTVSGNDYRVLQPRLVTDPNRNRTEVAFDALGMVVGTAVMGKPAPAPVEGDSLSGFDSHLTEAVVLPHLANPLLNPQTILQHATTRLVHDLFAYQRTKGQLDPQPAVIYTLARETHEGDPVPAGGLKIQHSFIYSDGFGREIQKKIQAEPGPVPQRDFNGKIIIGTDGQPVMTLNDVSPRWVGSGWTVSNNKGKFVRQYEPFFTHTHRFEFDVKIGVSPVLFYDPVGRVVATLRPNHTWEKVVFDAWRQETWDVNDTLLIADPKTDPNAGDFFSRLRDADYLPTWYTQRQGGTLGPQEQTVASKTAIHAATPTVAHADSLGRTFLTITYNRFKYSNSPAATPPIEEFYPARIELDIEGNQRAVRDAIVQNGDQQGRIVMRYDYDMLGNRIHQTSMEAGERWMLNDVAGKLLYSWDSRNHRFRTAYDQLRRPTDVLMREGAGMELLVGRTVYGETQANPEVRNSRGKVVQLFDQAGVVSSDKYDFKGNVLHSQRKLADLVGVAGAQTPAYKTTVDWSGAVQLEGVTYISHTRYDALNRPTQLIAPHSDQPGTTVNVIERIYNEANLLEEIHAWLSQNAEPSGWLDPISANLHAVTNIDYDAKGQRALIQYGNGAETRYRYDPETFRLVHLYTRRGAAYTDDCDNPQPPPATIAAPENPPQGKWCGLQNLRYTYDPAGNITHIRDDAQQTIYFRNKRVEPSSEYTYDAIYRLIEATGREHLGQAGGPPIPDSYNDSPRVGVLSSDGAGRFAPNDRNAMGTYLERYLYDAVGNFSEMQHRGSDPVNPGWTRGYLYNETSLIEDGTGGTLLKTSNRLTRTTVGAVAENYSIGGNGYDAHGNVLRMPHLQVMQWNFKDQLEMTRRQAVNAEDADGVNHDGERTWYVYDSTGQRVRKITELPGGNIKDERIYLGGIEVHRKNGANPLVRETLHIMDDKKRICLVETRTSGSEPGVPAQIIRYQFSNHLGSASLELDDMARIISYEEYTPYGSTTYEAVRSQTETPKRYRYTGKERDGVSGLYYHGARYFAPWLGRWISCDPLGVADGLNQFVYVQNNPIRLSDPTGMLSWGQIAGIAAAVVVGTAVTVLTAGLAGPLVGAAAASVIGGIVGGAVGAGVGEAVEAHIDNRESHIVSSAIIGGITGGLLAGAGAGISAGLRTAAGQNLASKVAASVVGRVASAAARRVGQSAVGQLAKRAVGALREPAERLGQRISQGLGLGPGARAAADAEARAVATRLNVRNVPDVTRTVRSATSGETFTHHTGGTFGPDVAGAQIEAQGALRLSQPGGFSGQWGGESAYAFEGGLAPNQTGSAFQFKVPPQTAVETITAPSLRDPIIRLVPPPGQEVVPIRITGSSFAPGALEAGHTAAGRFGLLAPRVPFGYGITPDITGLSGGAGHSSNIIIGPSVPTDDRSPQVPSVGVSF
jgi:RHS repeat-associated protein